MVSAKSGHPEERGGQNRKKGEYCLWQSPSAPHWLLVNQPLTDSSPADLHNLCVYVFLFSLKLCKSKTRSVVEKADTHFSKTELTSDVFFT